MTVDLRRSLDAQLLVNLVEGRVQERCGRHWQSCLMARPILQGLMLRTHLNEFHSRRAAGTQLARPKREAQEHRFTQNAEYIVVSGYTASAGRTWGGRGLIHEDNVAVTSLLV